MISKRCFEKYNFKKMFWKIWFQKHVLKNMISNIFLKIWLQKDVLKNIISKTWFEKYDFKNCFEKYDFKNMFFQNCYIDSKQKTSMRID